MRIRVIAKKATVQIFEIMNSGLTWPAPNFTAHLFSSMRAPVREALTRPITTN